MSKHLDITAKTDIGLRGGKLLERKFDNFADANKYAKTDSKDYGKCVLDIKSPKLDEPFVYTYRNGELTDIKGL